MNRSKSLTGIPRKLKDNAAKWHNFVARWNTLTCTGSEVFNKICNYITVSGLEDDITRAYESDEVIQLLDELSDIHHSLVELYEKIKKTTQQFQNIDLLNQSENSSMSENVSCTWNINEFYELSSALLLMFKQELQVKRSIIENATGVSSRSRLLFLTTTWTYQPCIEEKSTKLLEMLLTETDNR